MMKKLTGFLLTLGICILCGAALFFTFTRLSSSTRDLILSKIPFFGKKQQITFSTKTTVVDTKNLLTLKTASFDIDFLIHLEHDTGRFIALYPYQVTAGIDLRTAEITSENNHVNIVLDEPLVLSSSSSDVSNVLVLRDSLPDAFLDYDAYFKPVKKAFEQKAYDEAVQNGILENCKDHAERFLHSFSPNKELQISYRSSSDNNSISRIEAPSMPVYFSMNTTVNNEGSVWNVYFHPYLSRDELYISLESDEEFSTSIPEKYSAPGIQKIRFGRIVTSGTETFSSITEKAKQTAGEKDITAVFSNPLQKNDSKTVLFADERGFYRSITAFKDGTAAYLQTSDVQGEMHKQDYSPLLFYTAMSVNYDSSVQDSEKRTKSAQGSAYSALYDKAKTALVKKNYAAVNQYISVMRSQEPANPDVIMLSSLNDFLYKNTFNPTGLAGYENFDDHLRAAHVIKTNAVSKLTEENRQKLIGTYLHEKRLKEYFEAYFLKYRTELALSAEEETLYIDDLIMSGAVITKELFGSLNDERRKTYLENIMLFNDEEQKIRIENDGGVTYILCGSAYDKLYAPKNRGPSYIQKQLSRTASSIYSNVILVFPEKKLFTEFSAIAFEKSNLVLFNNITSALFVNEHIRVPYASVSFYGENFKLGNFAYTDALVRSVLYQLHQVYAREESYALDISLDISTQLIKAVLAVMDRPSI